MILIKIQSWTDIITNSSTEIFCCANNANALRDFIGSLLKVLDPTADVDKLFHIGIVPDLGKIKDLIEDGDLWGLIKDFNLDKDFLLNALNLSSRTNLLPLSTYLEGNDTTLSNFLYELMEQARNSEIYIEEEYVISPVDEENTDLDLIAKINQVLSSLPHVLYEITEVYN